jgi:hypothetical protein
VKHSFKFDVSHFATIINDDGSLSRNRIGRLALTASRDHEPTNRDITTNDKEWDTEELELQRCPRAPNRNIPNKSEATPERKEGD